MKDRIAGKAGSTVRLSGNRAGCHDRFCARRRLVVRCFMLTTPFIEPRSRKSDAHPKTSASSFRYTDLNEAAGAADATRGHAQRTSLPSSTAVRWRPHDLEFAVQK